jgi:hypothetical protein
MALCRCSAADKKKDATMNTHETGQHAPADTRRKSRSEATCHDSIDYQYGRRVERDGSWSIYHVFTGIPAKIQGLAMTGMSHDRATEGMLSLNRRNEARRREHGRSLTRRLAGQEGFSCQP